MKLVKAFAWILWLAFHAIPKVLIGFFVMAAFLAGAALAIYVAIWIMLIGGITDFINIFKSQSPATMMGVGFAIAKIILSPVAGFLIFKVAIELGNELYSEITPFEKSYFHNKLLIKAPPSEEPEVKPKSETYKIYSGRRAYEAWTTDEDSQLHNEVSAGLTIDEIATNHGRTKNAISSRIRRFQEH